MVTLNNVDIIDDELEGKFPAKEVSLSLSELTPQITPIHVNIIFVDERLIRKLNNEYRDKDEGTDVLTFLPSFEEVDIAKADDVESSIGEIYICPKYIIDQLDDRYGDFNDDRLLEEVYRMIIHGLLHLSGWEHTTVLDYDNMREDIEPMFVEQEKLLAEFRDDLDIKLSSETEE